MPDPTKTIKLPRLASEPLLPLTDQGEVFVYYDLPVGLAVDLGTIFSPLRAGLVRYEGNLSALSTNCGTAPPVDTADPVWGSFQPMGFVASQPYEQFLPFSALTPASGQTITDITAESLQSFLTIQPGNATGKWLRGSVPAGYASVSFSLRGVQGNGRYANKTFTIAPVAAATYACFVYRASTRKLTLYVGADGTGSPSTQLRIAPAAFADRGPYNLRPLETNEQTIAGQSLPFYFSFTYENVTTGHYEGAINWLGQELFYNLDVIADTNNSGSLTLSATAPMLPVTGSPMRDGDIEDIVNNAPTVVTPTGFLTCYYGVAFSHTLPATMFTDADNDPLTWSMEYSADGGVTYGAMPNWAGFTSSTRTFYGTSVQTTNAYFRKVVSDGNGGIAYDPFFLLTFPIN